MLKLDLADVPKHIFSANEIKQYSECARKRYYASRDCLAIRAVTPNGNLVLGKKVHEMLEYYYTEGTRALAQEYPFDEVIPKHIVKGVLDTLEPFQLTEEDKEALGPDLSTFNCIHENYKPRLIEDLAQYECLGCEMEFKLNNWPIDGVQYHGQIDMAVRKRGTNELWFFEHKTCKDFRPEIYNRFDVQLHTYTVVGHNCCSTADYVWGGMILNEIKKAKTVRGYAEHRMYYTYDDEEMLGFQHWITAKTQAAVSPENKHEPCNTYMTCKMCEYADICLKYGYGTPKTHEEILSDASLTNEDGEPLYKYEPREQEDKE